MKSQSVKSVRSMKSSSTKSFGELDSTPPDIDPFRLKRTCFMVEIRSATISTVDFRRMMENGMNVCVMKSEFFTEEEKKLIIRRLNKAASQMSQKLARVWPIMIGCSLRTLQATSGLVADEKGIIHMKQNHEVILTNDIRCYDQCTADVIFVGNCTLYKEAQVGMEITFNDAICIMECTEIIDKKSIKCIVTTPGVITHMEPVFLRGCQYMRPEMCDGDLKVINFTRENPVDTVLIYYATAKILSNILNYFDAGGKKSRPYIFAGICNQQGIYDIDEILKNCDAIILCRGYLEHELPKKSQQRLGAIQKYVCGKCIVAGVPIYIFGGIFTHLAEKNVLLDSEIMDVRNILENGVTGLALRYRLEANLLIDALGYLRDLCRTVEPQLADRFFVEVSDIVQVPLNAAEAAVVAAIGVARQTHASLMILPTVTGQTAKYISKYYPPCIIIAVCTSMHVAKILSVFKPLFPMVFKKDMTGAKFKDIVVNRIHFAVDYAVRMKWIQKDQVYITLQRSSDACSYCDLVEVWNELSSANIDCPENTNDWPYLYGTQIIQYKNVSHS